jgi:hypothetical protein
MFRVAGSRPRRRPARCLQPANSASLELKAVLLYVLGKCAVTATKKTCNKTKTTETTEISETPGTSETTQQKTNNTNN